MAKFKGAIKVNIERCKGCGVCLGACPNTVIELASKVNGKGYNYAQMAKPDDCIGCSNCAVVCPDGVIEVYRVRNE